MAIITVREATLEDAADLARMLATPDQVAARMLTCQNVLTTFIGELDGQPVWLCVSAAHIPPILTGAPAGARRFDGCFPEGSVNARVERRLHEFTASLSLSSETNGMKPALVH